jgi:hypothetical protein
MSTGAVAEPLGGLDPLGERRAPVQIGALGLGHLHRRTPEENAHSIVRRRLRNGQ